MAGDSSTFPVTTTYGKNSREAFADGSLIISRRPRKPQTDKLYGVRLTPSISVANLGQEFKMFTKARTADLITIKGGAPFLNAVHPEEGGDDLIKFVA